MDVTSIIVLVVLVVVGLKVLQFINNRPKVSTGPEMDKVLMEKYQRDVRKYQRKVEAHNHGMRVAAGSGINNAGFSVPPKPPRRPILSTER